MKNKNKHINYTTEKKRVFKIIILDEILIKQLVLKMCSWKEKRINQVIPTRAFGPHENSKFLPDVPV